MKARKGNDIMSIKFQDYGNKIKITFSGSGHGFGKGFSIYAKNPEQAVNSFKHYYGLKHNTRRCPSCKRREERKSKK